MMIILELDSVAAASRHTHVSILFISMNSG